MLIAHALRVHETLIYYNGFTYRNLFYALKKNFVTATHKLPLVN